MDVRREARQRVCDHSQGAGVALVETFKCGANRLMFMCINCKESVVLPDIIWDNVRKTWQKK